MLKEVYLFANFAHLPSILGDQHSWNRRIDIRHEIQINLKDWKDKNLQVDRKPASFE